MYRYFHIYSVIYLHRHFFIQSLVHAVISSYTYLYLSTCPLDSMSQNKDTIDQTFENPSCCLEGQFSTCILEKI